MEWCSPNIECCLSGFVIFQGIWTSIAKNPYSFGIFQRGVWTPCPPYGSVHGLKIDLFWAADLKLLSKTGRVRFQCLPQRSSWKKNWALNYPSVLTFVLDAHKNCLTEPVLLSTQNVINYVLFEKYEHKFLIMLFSRDLCHKKNRIYHFTPRMAKTLFVFILGANRLKRGLLRTGVTCVTHCACEVHSKNNFHIYVLVLSN